jgi:iron-sulfur cluster repair protein YtfE (RIC family)
MKFAVPQSLQIEHKELSKELAVVAEAGGKIGEAAKTVAYIMNAHFQKEEQFVLPALSLLPTLAQGKITPDMASLLAVTDQLKIELPQMIKEHKAMLAALRILVETARKERKSQYADFAERLIRHLQLEEELRYPMAILVGEHLKMKLEPPR